MARKILATLMLASWGIFVVCVLTSVTLDTPLRTAFLCFSLFMGVDAFERMAKAINATRDKGTED